MKYRSLILCHFLFMSIFTLNAQITNQWVATTSGINYFFARDIASDKQGNTYLCGGGRDFTIAQIDPNGIQKWYDKYNANGLGNTDNLAKKIVVDENGDIYATGSISQELYISTVDIITIKYNSSGNRIWVKTYKGPGGLNDAANDIIIDKEGFIYVAGYSSGVVTNKDMIIIKYDKNGNQIWIKTYSGSGNIDDQIDAIKIDSQNNIIVAGTIYVNGNKQDCIIIKYDKNGNQIWAKSYDDSQHGDNYGQVLAIDSEDNIYVGGYESFFNTSQSNFFTIKYDSNANKLWEYHCPNTFRTSRISNLLIYSDSVILLGYYQLVSLTNINVDWLIISLNKTSGLTSWSKSFNGNGNGWDTPSKILLLNNIVLCVGDVEGAGTGYDLYLVGLDLNGNTIFTEVYNSPENLNDFCASVVKDNNNNIYMGGYKTNNFTATGLVVKYKIAASTLSAPNLISPQNNSQRIELNPTLSWTSVNGAVSYRLQVTTNANFSSTIFDQSGITSTSKLISGLLNNTTYYWRVNATDGNVTSDWSEVWSFTTQSISQWQSTNWPVQNLGIQAIATNSQNHIFVCTATDGIYRSTDLGNTWIKLNNGLAFNNIASISIDKSDRIFIGTHGDGVYFSNNNGNSWSKIGLGTIRVNKIFALNNYVFAGDGFNCTGVYRTSNLGSSWTNVQNGLGVCTGNVIITKDGLVFGGSGIEGMYKSTDYGNTWQQINNGLTSTNIATMVADNLGNIFVGTQTNIYTGMQGKGIFKTTNNGMSWQNLTNGITTNEISQLAVSSNGILFTSGAGNQAIFKSTNSGNTWNQFNQGLPNPADVGPIGITKSGYIFAAINNKIYKYFDQTTDIKSNEEVGFEYKLSQNFPNPFNPSTTIQFSIPHSQFVNLKVYDVLGREVSTLVNEEKLPGNYEVKFDGSNLPSGIYFYRLQAGSFSQTKKLLLLK